MDKSCVGEMTGPATEAANKMPNKEGKIPIRLELVCGAEKNSSPDQTLIEL